MKTNYLIMLFVTGLVITVATMVIADPGGAMRDHEKPDFSPLARIDLSSEQTEQIRKLRIAREESIAPFKLLEHQAKAELDIFWLQMTPDKEKITSAQKKIHDIKFQIMEKETDFRLAIREVLTGDQLSRFLALGGNRCDEPDKFAPHPPRPQQPLRY